MARHDLQHRRVWPWVLVILGGLLTTAGGTSSYEMLGWLATAAATAMTVTAVRSNRAGRRAALAAARAAAAAQAARPGKKPGTAARSRKPGAARRAVRKVITLLP